MSGPLQGGHEAPRVSVLIVSHNTRDDLLRCLDCLVGHLRLPAEVVVVDNASVDGSVAAVRQAFPGTRIVESDENLGFARASNRGLQASSAPYVLILNPDAEVQRGAVETLVDLLESRRDVAVVGPRTLSADGTIQVSSGPDLTPLQEWRQRRLVHGVRRRRLSAVHRAEARHGREHEPDWVSASCFLARRTALESVGGFDETFFLYLEDADLCRRLRRAGWHICFTPKAVVVHHLGRSMVGVGARPRLEHQRSRLLYYRKHHGPLLRGSLYLHLVTVGIWALMTSIRGGEVGQARRKEGIELLTLVLHGPAASDSD